MKRPIRPASALGWWTFWLGILVVFWGVLLPSLIGLLGRLLAGSVRIPFGFAGVLLTLILAIASLVVGIIAFRRGERSWMAVLAFAGAVTVGGFWILFALGELLMPH
jgi:hypothetical protein